MITPTASPSLVAHMKTHSVCLLSKVSSRSDERTNTLTSSKSSAIGLPPTVGQDNSLLQAYTCGGKE